MPVSGSAVAHALTLPVHVQVGLGDDVGVSVGGPESAASVTLGGAAVTVPNVGQQSAPPADSGPIPQPPALPDPVGGPVQDVTNTGNGVVGGVTGNGGGGGSSTPSTGSGGSNSSNNGGGSTGGGNSGGSGSPNATGGGTTPGATGSRPGGGSTPASRARARRAARRAGGSGPNSGTGARPANSARNGGGKGGSGSGGGGKKKDGGDGPLGPVSRVFDSIQKVVPWPVWALVGVLALLASGFALRERLVTRRAKRLERQREELLGDVGLLQRALLPDVPDSLKGIEVSVAYRPAEGPAAGGDFYDVFELEDGRTAIIVGDVCGHGRQALAVTALMRYTLRAYLGAGFEPRVALQVAGRTIDGDPDGELTTVVLAVYDAGAGTLTYACAGHEPPIILGPAAHEPVTVSSSPPIGGFMATGHRQTTVPLPPGSAACFFTDGLVEARLGDEMIGRGRLAELVTELTPGEGAQLLLERLAAAADRAPDDMAACLVRSRDDAVESREVRIEELEADASDLQENRVLNFLIACGIPETSAQETLTAARAKASEFGGVLLRVHASGMGGRVEIRPSEVAALPVPNLAAEARRRAALQISA